MKSWWFFGTPWSNPVRKLQSNGNFRVVHEFCWFGQYHSLKPVDSWRGTLSRHSQRVACVVVRRQTVPATVTNKRTAAVLRNRLMISGAVTECRETMRCPTPLIQTRILRKRVEVIAPTPQNITFTHTYLYHTRIRNPS